MEYKASLDWLAKITTAGAFIFLIVAYYLPFHWGFIFFTALILLICYLFSPQKYLVEDNELVIVRPAKDVRIPISDIAEIRTLDNKGFLWAIRLFAAGGLFGYFGKYYNSTFGSMNWYATQNKNIIFIRTKSGKKIIITPDDFTLADFLKSKIISIT